MSGVHQSFYLPRERSGPGYIYPEAFVKTFWEENKNKFWNPERGLYDDAMLCESMAVVEPEVKLNHEQEKFVEECKQALADVPSDMQTIEEAIEHEPIEKILSPSLEQITVQEAVAA